MSRERKNAIVDAILVELSSDEGMQRFVATLYADPVFRKASKQWDRRGFSEQAFAGSVLLAAIESGLRT